MLLKSNIFISAVYAKLNYKSTGTVKVQLEGQINDGKKYDNGDTVVDFKITGRKCRGTRSFKFRNKSVSTIYQISSKIKPNSQLDLGYGAIIQWV